MLKQLEVNLSEALKANPVVPVITVKDLVQVKTLAKKLSAEGYTVLEITLRTEGALDAIKAIKEAHPEMMIGAGTILSLEDAKNAVKVGADFIVTPATPLKLADALLSVKVPVIPGISTGTEAQTLYEMGYKWLKLFPVEAYGGIRLIKSLGSPLPHLKFMPSGGITEATAPEYLALPNVIAVGGSWMTK